MNRQRKIVRNLVILAGLLFILNRIGFLYFSPVAAHEASERTIHYGPSTIVHTEEFDKGLYLLCRYDKWVSCNSANRYLIFFWQFGGQVTGFENDKAEVIDFSGSMSHGSSKVYGSINDDRVREIRLSLLDGTEMVETEFHDGLFLMTWDESISEVAWGHNNIKAYDENGQLLYQGEI